MTEKVIAVLSALAPRLWAAHSEQVFESDVTVRVFSSRATSGDFLAKTTCSILTGLERSQQLIEFCWASGSRLSVLEGLPTRTAGPLAQEYIVWTSPLIIQRAPKRSRGR